jgi:hypothetical protein
VRLDRSERYPRPRWCSGRWQRSGLSQSRPVEEQLAVLEEGGRRGAHASVPVVDFPRGWEHLLGGDAGLTGDS